LEDLARDRRSAPTTRTHRLAALHAFCRSGQSEEPDRLLQCQKILAIPQRRHARPTVGSLAKEDMAALLAPPDLRTRAGRRDAVLLSVLSDTGARVQEGIDLSAGDLRLEPPAQVRLLGKGRKRRAVPLLDKTVQLLRDSLHEHHRDRPEQGDRPGFRNAHDQRFSRSGIRYILQKYVGKARRTCPGLPPTVTPHTLRHYAASRTMPSKV
jgi:site-specific recombinase XerD